MPSVVWRSRFRRVAASTVVGAVGSASRAIRRLGAMDIGYVHGVNSGGARRFVALPSCRRMGRGPRRSRLAGGGAEGGPAPWRRKPSVEGRADSRTPPVMNTDAPAWSGGWPVGCHCDVLLRGRGPLGPCSGGARPGARQRAPRGRRLPPSLTRGVPATRGEDRLRVRGSYPIGRRRLRGPRGAGRGYGIRRRRDLRTHSASGPVSGRDSASSSEAWGGVQTDGSRRRGRRRRSANSRRVRSTSKRPRASRLGLVGARAAQVLSSRNWRWAAGPARAQVGSVRPDVWQVTGPEMDAGTSGIRNGSAWCVNAHGAPARRSNPTARHSRARPAPVEPSAAEAQSRSRPWEWAVAKAVRARGSRRLAVGPGRGGRGVGSHLR